VFSTPTVVGDVTFVGSCAGNFYAINKTTGQLQWSYDIRRDGNQQSFHGDPLVTNDLILIGTDKSCDPNGVGHAYAFERDTGKVRWKYRSTSVPTDIVQLNSSVYFGSFQDQWSSVDLKTGSLNWSFSTGATNKECDMPKAPVTETGAVISELATEAKPVGRLAFANDSLFMFLQNTAERVGYLISVDSNLTTVRWQQRLSPDWASERPHLWKETVVAGNCRGELAGFRATDGEPLWNLSLKGCIRSVGSSDNMLFSEALVTG
jgi:outer membrane protein assembly factor BamB